jgi:hypothetical protein
LAGSAAGTGRGIVVVGIRRVVARPQVINHDEIARRHRRRLSEHVEGLVGGIREAEEIAGGRAVGRIAVAAAAGGHDELDVGDAAAGRHPQAVGQGQPHVAGDAPQRHVRLVGQLGAPHGIDIALDRRTNEDGDDGRDDAGDGDHHDHLDQREAGGWGRAARHGSRLGEWRVR